MGIVSIPKRKGAVAIKASNRAADSADWVTMAAGSALVVGGLLLFTDKRRAGVALAAAGTALALVEHEETVRAWWNRIPDVVDGVQELILDLQSRVSEFTARRSSLDQNIAAAVYGEGEVARAKD
jgi:hypothetical protein